MQKKTKESSDLGAAKVSGDTARDQAKTHPKKIPPGISIKLMNPYNNHPSTVKKFATMTPNLKSTLTLKKVFFLGPHMLKKTSKLCQQQLDLLFFMKLIGMFLQE